MRNLVVSIGISSVVIIMYFFFGIKISIDSTIEGINSLVLLQSIILGMYSVSLSIIAALHDTKLIRKLLRPNSASREEIQNINSSAFTTNIISLVILITFLFTYELIIANVILIFLFQLLIPLFIVLSLFYIYDFFKIINATLFKHNDHE